MTTFTYTNNVPNPPNSPSVDVVSMQTNTNSISGIIAVDHVGFGDPEGGTHNQSTYNAGTDPITLSTQGSVYTKTSGSDVELFYRHKSSGLVTQLTGPNSLSGFTGYEFLPGGLILQWGFKNGTHGTDLHFNPGDTGNVTFPLTFPSRVFTVNTTMNYNTDTGVAPSSGSAFIISLDYAAAGTTTTGFNWTASGSGGSYTVFYWTALGR